jgi:HD-GYP domain-containing protein (c-di-GMP phosphodiesterase class II)
VPVVAGGDTLMTSTASDQSGLLVDSDAIRFFPVEIATIEDGILEMDVYLDSAGDGSSYILYCARGAAFTSKLREKLVPLNVQFLYVSLTQHKEYRKALSRHLEKVYRDPGKKQAERIRVVRGACTKMIEDVLLFPERPEAVEVIKDVSRQFGEWVQEDEAGFSYLMDMATHDYYTVTHMVNVGVGCGLLAKRLRPDDKEWQALMIEGGLLHDVGKRKIPPEILNKEGKLSNDEWEVVKSHPLVGFDLVKPNPNINEIAIDMIRSHHERIDGAGYPAGLAGEQITLPARVCAVIDVFDAICSSRPYRGPTPPEQTLKIIAEGSSKQFDPEIVELWTRIVREMIEADPGRVPRPTPDLEPLPLEAFVQMSPTGSTGTGRRNRRRHPRFDCCLQAKARWLERRTEYPGKGDEPVTVIVMDISQGGAKVSMQLPLECDEVLELELPAKGRPAVKRVVRVMHVVMEPGPRWHAGVMFI